MTQRILFVDPAVTGAEGLLASIGDDTIVVWLDRARDGVVQMTEALLGLGHVDSIEVLSHGSAGSVQIGATSLDRGALARYADALSVWRAALAPQGDILLYGCNVADSTEGAAFVSALAQLTGADVAASTDLTGARGDWVLETATGVIDTRSSLGTDGYAGTLASVTGTDGSDSLAGTNGPDTLTGGLGNDTLQGGGGSDTAVFAGNSGEYRLGLYGGGVMVTDLNANAGYEGADYLHQVEVLRCADRDITLAVGGTIRANTYFSGTQNQSGIAVAANGSYLVTWSSYAQDGSGYGVYAQRFSATGAPVGPELHVSTTSFDDQQTPSIASFTGNGGGYVIVWQSDVQDGSLGGIYAQCYDLNGAAVGAEFRVNTTTLNNQYAPSVAALSNGGFVVSWTSDVQDGSGTGVVARRFNASGAAQSGEIQVNATTAGYQDSPVVAGLGNGAFVVAWTSNGQDGNGYGVYAQRIDSSGAGQGEFRVNGPTVGNQWRPAIAVLDDGGFVIAWDSYNADGHGYDVFARRYAADGTASGGQFLVSTGSARSGDQYSAGVTALSGGGFVVSWYGDNGYLDGAWAQRYNAAGAAVGGALQIDSSANGAYDKPALGALSGNAFVGVWGGYDLSGGGVLVQRFDANGQPIGLQIDGTPGADRIDVSGSGDLRAVGGDGDDTYVVNSAYGTSDVVVELPGGGNDTVETSVDWTLGANLENLLLTYENSGTGNALPNHITGSSYYGNVLAGLGGNDTLDGGSGLDLASYATAPSAVTVDLSLVTPQATGGDGTDTLLGIEGAIGSAFADTLTGDASNNAFYGGAGADTLRGGAGGDTLDGGTGNDLAVFSGAIGNYRFGVNSAGFLTVYDLGTAATESVRDVEMLQFADRTIGLPVGGQIRVNTTTQYEQQKPAIACVADDGSYVVAWTSQVLDASSSYYLGDIYAQRFAANGTPLGGEFRVNTTLAGSQESVAVAELAGGGFVVTWTSLYQDDSGAGVYARVYGPGGTPQSGEIAVNTVFADDQQDPAIAPLGNGFVIAWQSDGQDGSSTGIYAQRFGANGNPLGAEIPINTFTTYQQQNVDIVELEGGGFLVSWESWGQDDGNGYGLYARMFAANGTPTGAEFQVNSITAGAQQSVEFAALEGGGLVAVWTGYDALTYSTSIFARRFADDGTAVGEDWRVTALDDSYPHDASVAALANGGFVITWAAYDDNAVHAQRYGVNGAALGEVLRLSQPDNSASGAAPRVAALPDGGFIVTWNGSNDGWGNGIYTQRVAANGLLQLGELSGTAGADRLDIGGTGDMQAAGGAGNDTYVVNSLGDRLIEAPTGNVDTVEALISWTLGANFEHLRLLDGAYDADATGNGVSNQITGNAYGNVLDGRAGADTMDGGAGIDTAAYSTAPGAVVVSLLLQGAPQITGGGGADTLISIENLIGSAFADQLSGDALGNSLNGGGGRDTLVGGAGNDTLEGGTGNDLVPVSGQFADYRFGWSNGYLTITDLNAGDGNDGTDYVHGVETIRFADRDIASLTGGEIRVNTQTSLDQSAPAVVSLANGGTVVVWQSQEQDGSDYGIFAQRYSADGSALGGEFRINTLTVASQHEPAVAALAESAGGGFVVTWTSEVGDGEGPGVFAQRFDNAGNPLGAEFQVNSYFGDYQNTPTIAALSGGGFVIAWTSWRDDGNGYEIYAQRYAADGTAAESEFRVNGASTSTQDQPVITALNGGGFVVAWSSPDADGRGVYLQRFDASGDPLGAETPVNTQTDLDQQQPGIAALEGGGFVVAWRHVDLGGNTSIHLQRFGAAGARLGAELQVNTYLGYDNEPSVAALEGGAFVVVWNSANQDGSGYGVYGQRFNSGGAPLGAEFLVNATTYDSQTQPSVTGLSDGGFAVSWNSNYQDGSSGSIYLQRFDATGKPVLMEIEGTTGDDRIDLGGPGDLQAVGRAGDDTYVIDGSGDRLIEAANQGTDTVEALGNWTLGANFELLRLLDGGGAIDGTGTAAGDTIIGNSSANVLQGRGGDDLLDGGGGSDTASYADASVAVSVSLLLAGAAQNTLGAGSDTLIGIENLVGSAYADTLSGDIGANRLDGGTGGDTLKGGAGNDTLLGGGGADVALYTGNSTAYRFAVQTNGMVVVQHLVDADQDGQPDQGIDTLNGVETLRFADRDIVLKPGGETPVNTATTNDQSYASVAVLASGGYVVAWQSYGQDGASDGIYAQRFSASGAALGAEFRVNSFVANDQQQPVVTALTGGGFVVVWESYSQDGNGWGVYAQRFNASGVAQGDETQVNTYTNSTQYTPCAVALTGGGYVIAWSSYLQDGSGEGIYARRYDALGAAQDTAEFKVNNNAVSDQREPSLAALANGGFVVSWTTYDAASGYNIHAQRYAADGTQRLGEIAVNTTLPDTQQDSASAGLEDGSFVVVWESYNQDGSDAGIYARHFSATGTPVDAEFRVNTYTPYAQSSPAVTALVGGGFVVTWESNQDGNGYGIYAQRYDADGVAQGLETRVNDYTYSTQSEPGVDATPDGGFVVTWQSYGEDGYGYGIYTQRFDAGGARVLVQIDGTPGDDRIDLGGAGNMQAAGGADDDTYVLDSPGDRPIENAAGGNDTVEALVSWTLGGVDEHVENLSLGGNSAINGTGNAGANVITGNDQANILSGGLGDDLLYGRGGTDIAAYSGMSNEYLVEQNPGFVIITDNNPLDGDTGTDVLVGIETLRFIDQDLSITDVSVIGEISVNKVTTGNQTAPALAEREGGGFVAVWQSPDGTGNGNGIYLQLFDPAETSSPMGIPLLAQEIKVNTAVAGEQVNPAVVVLTNGDIVVTWESGAVGARNVMAQRFDSSGTPQGSQINVNSTTASEQLNPSIAALTSGGFVITWQSNAAAQDDSSYGIVARSFAANGTPASPEFNVNAATANAQLAPVVSELAGGAFVIAWESALGDGNGYGVVARMFSSPTDATGVEIAVNTTTAGDQRGPAIANLADGKFVLTWQSADGGGQGIYARVFNANGSAASAEFRVNTTTGLDQTDPEVAALTSSGFVVSWTSTGQDGSGTSVHAQRYDLNGVAQGSELRVNTTTVNAQQRSAITALDGNNFLVAWQSNLQDDSGSGIYAKGFDVDGNPLVPPIVGTDGDDVLDLTIGDVAAFGLKGKDLYIVDSTGDVTIEKPAEGIDTVQASISWSLGANLENLIMVGAANLGGTGNGANNSMSGNAGANTLRGNDGSDSLDGGEGNDLIYGGSQADPNGTSDAAGNDTLDGGDGVDSMEGGLGNDIYYVDNVAEFNTVGTLELPDTGGAFSSAMLTLQGRPPHPAAGSGSNIDKIISQVSYTLRANIENLDLATGSGDIDGIGNELNNILNGNEGDNSIEGLDGNDIVGGDAGNDTLDGGNGADAMAGGLDDDLYIIDGNDTLIESPGEGFDTVRIGASYTLMSNFEGLELSGSANLSGTGNGVDNRITGNSGNNHLFGAVGNDTLQGGAAADTLTGGAGNDTYLLDAAGDTVDEAAVGGGTDTVEAAFAMVIPANVEILKLSGAADLAATGNAAANELHGNSGANTLNGMGGVDTMAGGAGNDTYVTDGLDQVSEHGGEGFDLVRSSGNYTLGAELEHLVLTAGSTRGTGNVLANSITGSGGNNTLDGGAGADTLIGGAGNDTYIIDGEDTVTEPPGEGTDTVRSADSFTLGSSIEYLALTGSADVDGTGSADPNAITGNSGANVLDGGAGADTLSGGAGDDEYHVDVAGDELSEGSDSGRDTVFAGVSWTLGANFERLVLEGAGLRNGSGNSLDNEMTGTDGANNLNGAVGKDTLTGGAGNDTLSGGSGVDSMAGGTGNDTYNADATDKLVENSGEGNDLVRSAGSFTLALDFEQLLLTGAGAADGTGNVAANLVTGNSGGNSLFGASGNDTLVGNAGNDSLRGGAGIDSLSGGLGNDSFYIDSDDTYSENTGEGNDTVIAAFTVTLGASFENLTLSGNETAAAIGNAAANVLTGNDAANVLDGKTAADTMRGGKGADSYFVTPGDVIEEGTGQGTDTVTSVLSWTLGANFEHLVLTGTGNFVGTGNELDNRIEGNGGKNTLDGGIGSDTLIGGAGDDVFVVDSAADVVTEVADQGKDTVQSAVDWTLADALEKLVLTGTAINGGGNAAANTISGNAAANVLSGEEGNDTLTGLGGIDTMTGGLGNDTYVVTSGDVLSESSGGGSDTVKSAGNWTLGSSFDKLVLTGNGDAAGAGNGGANRLTGNNGDNRLSGFGGSDTLVGGVGNDTLEGGKNNDSLVGAGGADELSGAAGNDTLAGGLGNDTLDGGAGSDVFLFDTALDAATNLDTLAAFETGVDLIRLDHTVFGGLAAGVALTDAQLRVGAVSTASTAEHRLICNTSTGALYYDEDGQGGAAAVQIALLGTSTHPASIAAADFSIVA